MKKKSVASCLHQELGDYLEVLRCVNLMDSKYFTIKNVCKQISMSPRTYDKVKRGLVRI